MKNTIQDKNNGYNSPFDGYLSIFALQFNLACIWGTIIIVSYSRWITLYWGCHRTRFRTLVVIYGPNKTTLWKLVFLKNTKEFLSTVQATPRLLKVLVNFPAALQITSQVKNKHPKKVLFFLKQESCFAFCMELSDQETIWPETAQALIRRKLLELLPADLRNRQLLTRSTWFCGL